MSKIKTLFSMMTDTTTRSQGFDGNFMLLLLVMALLYFCVAIFVLIVRDLLLKLFSNKSKKNKSKDVLKRYEMWNDFVEDENGGPFEGGCSSCSG
jgi:hypothetical protein